MKNKILGFTVISLAFGCGSIVISTNYIDSNKDVTLNIKK